MESIALIDLTALLYGRPAAIRLSVLAGADKGATALGDTIPSVAPTV
jgi:hypothetical protein